MATKTTVTQPQVQAHSQYQASGSQNISVGTQGTASGITVSNNGTITVSGPIGIGTIQHYNLLNSYYSPLKAKCFKLGDTSISIYNCDNKYFIVDNVKFSFVTNNGSVSLKVDTQSTTQLNSLEEVRNYIKTMKLYYLKCKEFEKQLKMSGDFA
jgi:hypothetical protein